MRTTVREGVVAGALAATAVVIWFFVIDLILGRSFATPELLGRALFGRLGVDTPGGGINMFIVLGYTVFHYAAFIVAGLVVALIVSRAKEEPSVLAGALILFVMFEVAFHALLSMFGSIPVLGAIAWYNVAIGNLIAAVTMGVYMWRVHPELKAEFGHALGGE